MSTESADPPAGAAFAFIQMKIFSNFHCDVIFDLFNSQIFGHFPFSVFYLTRCDHSDFSGPSEAPVGFRSGSASLTLTSGRQITHSVYL